MWNFAAQKMRRIREEYGSLSVARLQGATRADLQLKLHRTGNDAALEPLGYRRDRPIQDSSQRGLRWGLEVVLDLVRCHLTR